MGKGLDDGQALLRLANFDHGLTEGLSEIVGHDLGGLADADSVIENPLGDPQDVGLLPHGASAAEFAGPLVSVLVLQVGIAHGDIRLAGGQPGHRGAVRIGLDHMGQIADSFAVVFIEPQGGIDVAGGGGGAHDGPGSARQLLPGQLIPGVDLGGQGLALLAGTGQEDGAVIGGHLPGIGAGGAVVPVGGILRIFAVSGPQGRQQHIAVITVQGVGAAGDEAHIGASGGEGLAHGLVGGAYGELDILYVVALFQELLLQHTAQGLGGGHDDLGGIIGCEGDVQLLHHHRPLRLRSRGGGRFLLGTAGG